jgi:hypothetical protein
MENKTVLIVVALVLAYLLFLRKPSYGAVGGMGGAVPKPISPKPATPNNTVSTGGAIAAAAISAAPSILSSLGSFFSSDNNSDYSDSAAFSDDEFVGDY